MNADTISVEILDDGSIKVVTDKVSGPNHMQAEAFLRALRELSGGDQTRTKRAEHTHHGHTHAHDHETA